MTIQRPKYLDMLIAGQGNGLVKIVTGGRRCGKSFLLFVLFRNYLLRQGVEEDHIIGISFDDRRSRALRDPDTLLDYIDTRLQKDGKTHY
ncbi:MAG: AAA family ATPase, partial [Bacteroidota bacterium]|nr:AAA family ATPase [Bacteroidota bacterium]